uniref:Enoyl-CoA delta isomerase 1 n=1 Tax=Panthera tigris altaica TaxID=74533 RepID=A0A8C9K1Z4_PANTA
MVGCASPVLGVSFLLFVFKLGVAVIKLKNPPVNSLSLEVLTEFVISLEKLENDKTFRGVILTSDCPGIFSAGLDLTEMCGKSQAHYAEYWRAVQELWLRLYLSNLVLIAAINAGKGTVGGDPRMCTGEPPLQTGVTWWRGTSRGGGRDRGTWSTRPGKRAITPRWGEVLKTTKCVLDLSVDHARQLTKNLMRKATADRLVKQRDADVQYFLQFISRDSIQKSLRVYLDKLRQKKG